MMMRLRRMEIIRIAIVLLITLFLGIMAIMSVFIRKDKYIHKIEDLEDGDQ